MPHAPSKTPAELADAVRGLGKPRVLVVGDVILDRYVWGEAERVSQEAPVILLREAKREVRLGGAANVANMLAGLGAGPVIAGVVGDDVDGRACRGELEAAGVDTGGLIADPGRPTTVKERFLGRAHHRHPHQMLRVDREVRDALGERVEDTLLARVEHLLTAGPGVAAVLLSDYGKGVLTPGVAAGVIVMAAAAGVPVLCDPPGSGECSHFTGATAVTPNRTETGRAVGSPVETVADAEAAGRLLCERHGLEHAFVTVDSDGIVLARADGSTEPVPHPPPGRVRHHRGRRRGAGGDGPRRRRGLLPRGPGQAGERRPAGSRSRRSAAPPSRGTRSSRTCSPAAAAGRGGWFRKPTPSPRTSNAAGRRGSGSSSPTAASICCTPATSRCWRRPPPRGTCWSSR